MERTDWTGLLLVELQALDERTDAELQRTGIVDIIHLENGQILVRALEYVTDFIQNEGIRTTTKGSELHKINTVGGVCHPLGRFHDTVHIGPLRYDIDIFQFG